ncbi:ankyrin repeat-containing domain protein [Lactarius psammicola]|nr:ankyrin repeat-containing domain protein [Lactarius psammicola]
MERDRFKFAQILLERGADANVVNNNGKTPLRILSESRDHDEGNFVNHARLLLEHGVRVNRRHEDSNSNTPLILEILDATMENKMGETSVQQGPRGQYGPQERGVGVAQRSPKHGENQTMPSRFQSDLGPIQIAILLLDHGANLNAGNNGGETSTYQEMEDVNEHHLTPLHLASLYGWVEMVRVLLDRGATVDSEDNLGRTPLHLVTESEYCSWLDGVRIAQLLLEHGADVNAQDKNNTAPLHAASYYGRVYMVQVLLDHDAMADLEGNSGRTPYYPAHDGVRIAKLLLEHGADVNAQVKDSMTPLHVASYYGRVDMVQVLLDHGATANSEGSLGRTPLHLVAGSRFYPVENGLRMANLLLDHGADRVDMVRLLLDHGATANSEVNLGRTLLHLVAEGKCGFGTITGTRCGCQRTRQRQYNPTAFGVLFRECRNLAGAAQPWCNCQFEAQAGPDLVAPSGRGQSWKWCPHYGPITGARCGCQRTRRGQ